MRQLVVDDNVEAADSHSRLLRLEGHQVWSAYDGLSAVDLARSSRPEAVILDLGLPGIDGYEVARRLRNDGANGDLLLVALSGYGQEEDIRRSTEAGFDHHFNKPLDFAGLLKVFAIAFGRNGNELVGTRRS
jgi:CheY-like chemotaxis protein